MGRGGYVTTLQHLQQGPFQLENLAWPTATTQF